MGSNNLAGGVTSTVNIFYWQQRCTLCGQWIRELKIQSRDNYVRDKHIKTCARCGKVIGHWQWVNGYPVCADDRECYAKNPTRAMQALKRNKLKYGDDE